MMQVEEVLRVAKRRPFQPFTLDMSDGSAYAVRHPEQMVITRRALYVGLNGGQSEGALDDVAICDLVHVTRLTPGVVPKKTRKKRS